MLENLAALIDAFIDLFEVSLNELACMSVCRNGWGLADFGGFELGKAIGV